MSTSTTDSGIFCRKCNYDLRASEGKCPECGKPFDRTRRRTFRRRPLKRWKRVCAFLAVLMVGVATTPLVGYGVLRGHWEREQRVIAKYENSNATFIRATFRGIHPTGPAWLQWICGKQFKYLLMRVTDAQLPAKSPTLESDLEALGELQRLNLIYGTVHDRELAYLRHVPKLEDFTCQGPVTDDGLAVLAVLKSLRHLSIFESKINGSGLKYLRNRDQLEGLVIAGEGKFSKEGLTPLGGLKNLRLVHLKGFRDVDDDVLRALGRLTRLTSLIFSNGNFVVESSDPDMLLLSGLVQLDFVNLTGMYGINERRLRQFALPNPPCVWLRSSDVTDEAMTGLAGCTKLKTLVVGKTSVSLRALEPIRAANPNMEIELPSGAILKPGMRVGEKGK